jgi:tripartite-type tricarboxylate transporter receptor subunit TctC
MICVSLLTTTLLLTFAGLTRAEYPERPINLYCPYSGGTADASLRAIADHVEKTLGQPMIVVNKPGASGSLAAGLLASARPDGYTLGMVTFAALTMSPHMYTIPYDPLTSFDYILAFGEYLYGICARSDSPFKSLKDLITYAKANPGKVKYSTVALATPTHFSMTQLGKMEGIKWDVVVFKETPAAVSACLGGHVDLVIQNPTPLVPLIKAGQLRLLCSLSDIRWPWVPEVPTVRELGYNFEVVSWMAMAAPKGTPKPIMGKLVSAFKKALDDPEFLKIMDRIYVPVVYRSGQEFRKLVEEGYKENDLWIKELGLHKSQKK